MSQLGNPLGMMGGAADSLGLSAAAQASAKDLADKMRKKKMEEAKMMKTAGSASAYQDLMTTGMR